MFTNEIFGFERIIRSPLHVQYTFNHRKINYVFPMFRAQKKNAQRKFVEYRLRVLLLLFATTLSFKRSSSTKSRKIMSVNMQIVLCAASDTRTQQNFFQIFFKRCAGFDICEMNRCETRLKSSKGQRICMLCS